MNNSNGKINYSIGLLNDSLKRDADEAISIFNGTINIE